MSRYRSNTAIYDGIVFRSDAEVRVYKKLVSLYGKVDYEKQTYTMIPTKRCIKIPFYNRIGGKFVSDYKPLQRITYTPDFSFNYKGIDVIVEVKGFENDVFPYKKKLFRMYLEEHCKNTMYFEVRTIKEVVMMSEILSKESSNTLKLREVLCSLPLEDKHLLSLIKACEKHDWKLVRDIVCKLKTMTTLIETLIKQIEDEETK